MKKVLLLYIITYHCAFMYGMMRMEGPRFIVCDMSEILQWRHNDHDGVSNHQHHDCLLKRLFGRRSKKTPKLRVTGLCVGISSVTGEFSAQMASNAENVSIWWRLHDKFANVVAPLCINEACGWPISLDPLHFVSMLSWGRCVFIHQN